MSKELSSSFFAGDAVEVAQKLLGKKIKCGNCEGIIVETEAYKRDPASHAYKITPRSEIMLNTHGYVYVYVIYGMYHCLNFTTNEDDVGAVLIRAIEPTAGIEEMKVRRSKKRLDPSSLKLKDLCSGPSKLCDAFGIDKNNNALELGEEIQIFDAKEILDLMIHATSRVGITEGKELMWRFYIKGNEYISVKCKNESRA